VERFLDLLKGRRIGFTLTLASIATVLLINGLIEFGENIIKNKYLVIFSLIVLYGFVNIILEAEMWKDGA